MVRVLRRAAAGVVCIGVVGFFFAGGVLLPVGSLCLYGQEAPSIADEMVLDEWVWQRVSPEGREIAREYMEAYKKIVALYWNMEMSGTVYRYQEAGFSAEALKRPVDLDKMELFRVARESYLARYRGNKGYPRLDSEVIQDLSSHSGANQAKVAGKVEYILATPERFWRARRTPGDSPTLVETERSFREGEARFKDHRFAWAAFSSSGAPLHRVIFSSKERMRREFHFIALPQVDDIRADGDSVIIKLLWYPINDETRKRGDRVIVLDRKLGWVVKEVDETRTDDDGLKDRTRTEVDYEGVERGIGLVKRVRIWEARVDPDRLGLYYDFQRDRIVTRAPPESAFTLTALGFEVTPRASVHRWWQVLALIVGIIIIGLFVWRRLQSHR